MLTMMPCSDYDMPGSSHWSNKHDNSGYAESKAVGVCRGEAKKWAKSQAKRRAREAVMTPLYKTRLCDFFAIGACQKGVLCPYAHGQEDLRPSPDFGRTSICPILRNKGTCNNPDCRYAHSREELQTESALLKTRMCRFYRNGHCAAGQACRFAHTAAELQQTVGDQIGVQMDQWEPVSLPLRESLSAGRGAAAAIRSVDQPAYSSAPEAIGEQVENAVERERRIADFACQPLLAEAPLARLGQAYVDTMSVRPPPLVHCPLPWGLLSQRAKPQLDLAIFDAEFLDDRSISNYAGG